MHSYEQVGSEQLWETILLLRRTAQAIWCLRFHLGPPCLPSRTDPDHNVCAPRPQCVPAAFPLTGSLGDALHVSTRWHLVSANPAWVNHQRGNACPAHNSLQSWKPPPHPVGVLALRPSDARGASQSQVRRKQGLDRTRNMDRESRHQRMQGPLGWAMERDKPLGGLQHAPRPSLVGFSVSRRA